MEQLRLKEESTDKRSSLQGREDHRLLGAQGIKNRNVVLNDFKNNGTHVLLATTTCGETWLNIP